MKFLLSSTNYETCQVAMYRNFQHNFKCTIISISTSSQLGDRAFTAPADHAFGIVFLHMSVGLICPLSLIGPYLLSETEIVFNCSRHLRLVTIAFTRCV